MSLCTVKLLPCSTLELDKMISAIVPKVFGTYQLYICIVISGVEYGNYLTVHYLNSFWNVSVIIQARLWIGQCLANFCFSKKCHENLKVLTTCLQKQQFQQHNTASHQSVALVRFIWRERRVSSCQNTFYVIQLLFRSVPSEC